MVMHQQPAERAPGIDTVPVPAHTTRVPATPHDRTTGTLGSMRRLLLIANPAASGFTSSLHRDVVEILRQSFDVTTIWPNGPAEARTEASAGADGGFEIVVAMGGDGVVHQVANAIIDSPAALGVIPAGTTNVFCRVAGLPADPRRAATLIADATAVVRVPTLAVNESDGRTTRTHVATFAAGVGFDAEVIKESERRPMRKIGFGALHYARSMAKVTFSDFRGRRPTLRVTMANRAVDAVGAQFQVQEDYTYLSRLPLRLGSGPKPIATVLRKVTPLRMSSAVIRAAMRSDLGRVRGIDVWEGFERVEIEADPPAWIEADGELLGRASAITVHPDPRDLLVVSA